MVLNGRLLNINLFKKSFQCCQSQVRFKKFRRPDTPLPDKSLTFQGLNPRPPYWEVESFPKEFDVELPKGRIYDNKAFPIHLEPSKQYKWCTCGISKSQPMCDGSHTRLDGTEFVKKRPLYRPLMFTVSKAGTYHLCNCKQTSNKPFCDGTHRTNEVQTAVSS